MVYLEVCVRKQLWSSGGGKGNWYQLLTVINSVSIYFNSWRCLIITHLGSLSFNCWFSHEVTKIQTTKLSILLRFYFHGVLEQLKTNFQTNFRFKRVLGFVIEYGWISKLLRDAAFTWRPKELSFRIKKWLFSRNLLLSKQFKC